MADFGAPVVNANTAYNPNQAVQTLSGVLGIQQQRQALQGQAAQVQQQQISAQQQQVAFNEQQALAKLDMKKYIKNGVVDAASYGRDAMAAAPQSGLGIDRASKMFEVQRAQLGIQDAAQDLNEKQVKDATNALETVAERKDGNYADLKDMADNKKKTSPQLGPVMDHVMSIVSADDPWEKNQQKLKGLNMALKGVGTPIVGTALGADNKVHGTIQSPLSGALSQLGDSGVKPGLAPIDQPTYKAAVASATTRAADVGTSDVKRGNDVSALIQPSKQGIAITKEIDDMADQVHSGKFAAAISKAAAAAGLSTETYARQVLEKDLGRLRQTASEGAGTDERARTIISGLPTAESDNQTIHNATDIARGTFRQNLARGDLLNKVKTKDASLQGFQHADDILTSGSDPLMHEFKALKSPQERINFYRRHFKDPATAEDFKNKVTGMGHVLD